MSALKSTKTDVTFIAHTELMESPTFLALHKNKQFETQHGFNVVKNNPKRYYMANAAANAPSQKHTHTEQLQLKSPLGSILLTDEMRALEKAEKKTRRMRVL